MRRSIHGRCFTAAIAIAILGAGCERGRQGGLPVPPEPLGVLRGDQTSNLDPAVDSDPVSPSPMDAARFTIDDATLVAQLRDKLSASDAAEGKAVSVRASDGMVTLSGRVSSTAAREIAAEIVHDVQGVREVDNRIVVAQLSNRESRIE